MFLAAFSASALALAASGARAPQAARDAVGALLAAQDRDAGPHSLVETRSGMESSWGLTRVLVGSLAAADPQQRGSVGSELRATLSDVVPPPQDLPMHEISVPASWASQFKKVMCARSRRDWGRAWAEKFNAKLASGTEVSFSVRNLDAEAERDIRMMDYVRALPGVACYFEHATADGRVWILTEDLGDKSLAARFAELESQRQSPGKPFMPLDESLPILVDMLHGIRSLGDRGVVHFDLSGEQAVALAKDPTTGRENRVRISELGKCACAVNSRDDALSCSTFLEGRTPGSALRLPPEPLGTQENMWQVGLLFAKMVLGEYPTDTFVAASFPGEDLRKLDSTEEGRKRIQEVIRSKFDISDDKAFKDFSREYPDIGRLISGMLEKDAARRISSPAALKEAERLMTKLNMQAPSEPKPPKLPSDWRPSDWKQAPPASIPKDLSLSSHGTPSHLRSASSS
mmetsp:Transcript_110882/g.217321  ORF Transcript_110882/g.217321 Transcript_110882/m.217321 type:complete len:459 (+) Transcript_110882:49-1425(+)